MEYIDKNALVAEINRILNSYDPNEITSGRYALVDLRNFINTLEVKEVQPEPYFYCKYGGTMPLCSDCKRNHNNSSFKTEEITTWYAPSNGTKHCIDYIQREHLEMDLEKEVIDWWNNHYSRKDYTFEGYNGHYLENSTVIAISQHFFELGLKAQKGE